MAEFDRSYTTSYQSVIVSIALACTVFELFDVEKCRDLERLLSVIRCDSIERIQVHIRLYCN